MNRAIVTLTSGGAELGLKLQKQIPGSVLYTMPGRGYETSLDIKGTLKEFTGSIFNTYDMIIFIMATGIVIRMIAEFIKDKTTDPGILVMDEKGKFVISLLSGHIGGANKCAEYIASLTGAIPVITTSSDINGMVSPDMLAMKYGAVIGDMKQCRDITSIMVNGGRIVLHTDYNIEIPVPYILQEDGADGIIYLTNRNLKMKSVPALHLIPKNIVIGTGCRKDADPGELINFIEEMLDLHCIDKRAVSCVASIDIKKDEPAIKSLAEFLDAEAVFFHTEKISEVEHMFQSSDFVREKTGVGSVSEPCAYLASGCEGKILIPKKKRNGMTMAVVEKPLKEIL